jgi:hypothetical protein
MPFASCHGILHLLAARPCPGGELLRLLLLGAGLPAPGWAAAVCTWRTCCCHIPATDCCKLCEVVSGCVALAAWHATWLWLLWLAA